MIPEIRTTAIWLSSSDLEQASFKDVKPSSNAPMKNDDGNYTGDSVSTTSSESNGSSCGLSDIDFNFNIDDIKFDVPDFDMKFDLNVTGLIPDFNISKLVSGGLNLVSVNASKVIDGGINALGFTSGLNIEKIANILNKPISSINVTPTLDALLSADLCSTDAIGNLLNSTRLPNVSNYDEVKTGLSMLGELLDTNISKPIDVLNKVGDPKSFLTKNGLTELNVLNNQINKIIDVKDVVVDNKKLSKTELDLYRTIGESVVSEATGATGETLKTKAALIKMMTGCGLPTDNDGGDNGGKLDQTVMFLLQTIKIKSRTINGGKDCDPSTPDDVFNRQINKINLASQNQYDVQDISVENVLPTDNLDVSVNEFVNNVLDNSIESLFGEIVSLEFDYTDNLLSIDIDIQNIINEVRNNNGGVNKAIDFLDVVYRSIVNRQLKTIIDVSMQKYIDDLLYNDFNNLINTTIFGDDKVVKTLVTDLLIDNKLLNIIDKEFFNNIINDTLSLDYTSVIHEKLTTLKNEYIEYGDTIVSENFFINNQFKNSYTDGLILIGAIENNENINLTITGILDKYFKDNIKEIFKKIKNDLLIERFKNVSGFIINNFIINDIGVFIESQLKDFLFDKTAGVIGDLNGFVKNADLENTAIVGGFNNLLGKIEVDDKDKSKINKGIARAILSSDVLDVNGGVVNNISDVKPEVLSETFSAMSCSTPPNTDVIGGIVAEEITGAEMLSVFF